MSTNKNILTKLIQLPIPEVHDLYTQGNIPLAAGYIKAATVKKNIALKEDIIIIPREIANYGGDATIVQWIMQEKPKIVGFSNYMWNICRNISIAEKLKKIDPDVLICFGGPEIHQGHWVLSNNHIDSFFIGEGEVTFGTFLHQLKNNGVQKQIYQLDHPIDLTNLPNPYLEGTITPQPGESLFLETMRGCPYTCKYCFYSKSCAAMRYFPEQQLSLLFKLARHNKVPEIYFMDPSFNVSPQLSEKLSRVRTLNATQIPIHTEIRLEGVTPEIARAMKDAGFHSVEAGLQSTNEKTLTSIGRIWNKDKFIRGVRLLQEQGIDIKTGIILGLPNDSLEDLERTLDFVLELDLAESMEIYPLSIIPGTRLRDEAKELGIHYMSRPPYWVLSTPDLTAKDLKYAVELVENKLDIEFFPPVIPHFQNRHPDIIHFLDLRNLQHVGNRLKELYQTPEKVGHSLTILTGVNGMVEYLSQLGEWLRNVSPSTLVQIVMDGDSLPSESNLRQIARTFFQPQHYFNQIHHYKTDRQNMYSVRFFHLTADLRIAESYLYQPQFCDLVLRFSKKLLVSGADILEEKPILWVDSAIPEELLSQLTEIYLGFENFLILNEKE